MHRRVSCGEARARNPPMTGNTRMAQRWILHVDLDQFLAAVEVLRRPELAGRPVVVGGDGNPRRPRQVVATASYEARAFGVRSGMPLGQAPAAVPGRRLPAVGPPGLRRRVGRGDGRRCGRSRPSSRCGAGTRRSWASATDDPEAFAPTSRRACSRRPRLSCAVGIGDTRLQAKTATGFAKPGGIARLTRRDWIATMGARPVTAVWGIGGRTAEPRRARDHDRRASSPAPTTTSWPATSGRRSVRTCASSGWAATTPARRRTVGRQVAQQGGDVHADVAAADAIAGHVDRLAREVTAEVVARGPARSPTSR